MTILGWLGRRATAALACGALAGLALPWLAEFFRALLPEIVFVFIVASFLKVDWGTVSHAWREPALPLRALVWCVIGVPILLATLLLVIPLTDGLTQSLAIWAASPPMTAAIVFAMILRLDTSLTIGVAMISMLVVPFTAPILCLYLADVTIAAGSLALVRNVAIFVAAAMLVAVLLRRCLGKAFLEKRGDELNGLVILTLIAYAAALTAGIGSEFMANPMHVLQFLLAGFVSNIAVQLLTTAVFWRDGKIRAVSTALLAGNRNMSVLCANLGAAFTPEIALFFAASHVPIYTLPWLLRRVYARISARPAELQRLQRPPAVAE